MKRHPHLIPLSREHHQGLLLAQLLKADAPPYPGLPTDLLGKIQYARQKYEQLLRPHFEKEETRLFARIPGHYPDLQALIATLQEEHAELHWLFGQLHHPATIHPDALDHLGKLLEQHIRREERQFFQELQVSLTEAEMHELGQWLEDW
ncbi:MAG: hemerythrin domain-containing protein [Microscillaceae bacterium]|nr:hemerythrin domain-containing protein [Microscillaceae bacterium]